MLEITLLRSKKLLKALIVFHLHVVTSALTVIMTIYAITTLTCLLRY